MTRQEYVRRRRAEAAKLYKGGGRALDIAKRLGVSESTVYDDLRVEGVETRARLRQFAHGWTGQSCLARYFEGPEAERLMALTPDARRLAKLLEGRRVRVLELEDEAVAAAVDRFLDASGRRARQIAEDTIRLRNVALSGQRAGVEGEGPPRLDDGRMGGGRRRVRTRRSGAARRADARSERRSEPLAATRSNAGKGDAQ